MVLEFVAGDMFMVDFAGKKQYCVDVIRGERVECEVFVATLPYMFNFSRHIHKLLVINKY